MHKVRNASNAALVGMALGFAIVVAYLPGGYDALMFYLRPPFPESTAPAWIYLVTAPLSKLPWPLGWQILVFATLLSAGVASWVWGNTRWWLVACSAPMVWSIWLGQIEVFPLVGLVVGGLVLQRKIDSTWLGIACLALMTKPQVGYGILLFFLYRTWSDKDLGLQALLKALIPIAGVLVLTVLIWPEWPLNWLRTLREFQPTWWNAAVWPYGLLGWPVALAAARRTTLLSCL